MSLLLTDNVPSPASWANPSYPSLPKMVQVFSLSIVYAARSFLVSMSESVFALEAMSYLYSKSGFISPVITLGIRSNKDYMSSNNFYDAGPRPFKMTSSGDP
jgi:hypothetical protein